MGVKLKNAAAVRAMWDAMISRIELAGIVVRHAHKPADGNARCDLSDLGVQQATAYGAAISDAMKRLMSGSNFRFLSSNTLRNISTLALLVPYSADVEIEHPKALDLPFLGPNDEDLATCRALAERLNTDLEPGQKPYSPKSLFSRLEEFGEKRVGETTAQCEARIRSGLLEAIEDDWQFIYSMNSPVGNQALKVGADGAFAELETIFVGYDFEKDTFTLLGRIAPEWEETPD